MKISWKKLTLFGLCIGAIPVAIVAKAVFDHERAELLRSHRKEMADCTRCHKLLSGKAGIAMMLHMQDDHKITPDDSYEIIADLYRKLWTATQRARDAKP